LHQLSGPATVPPKLSFNVPGRLWEFRLQKVVRGLLHSLFLGPAVKPVCAPIPKNNSTAAETTYENGIVAPEQGLFFDGFLDEIVFINLPSMVFAHNQPQP
jgi:hypothetical protein